MLNLRVELPIESRLLYTGENFRVAWLALPGDEKKRGRGERLLVENEYSEQVDDVKVQAELRKADSMRSGQPYRWPKNFSIESIGGGVRALVIKAPKRGNRIYRLICHEVGSIYYVAVAKEKKDQKTRDAWHDLARQRIALSLTNGGP